MSVTAVGRNGRVYVRKFDYDEARRRYAAGESQSDLAREFGVTQMAVCRVVNPRVRERMDRTVRESQAYVCEECRGPCVYNQYNSQARHDRRLCRDCSDKARRSNVTLTDGGRVVEVKCVSCHEWKNPDDFGRGTRFRDLRAGGFHNACRQCQTKLRQDYRERHKVPCVRCGKPRLPQSEKNGGARRSTVRDTGLCVDCYRDDLSQRTTFGGAAA